MADRPVLTYFDWEGLGECVRLTLLYNEVDFEDRRIQLRDWPTLRDKTPFAQLPMLTIGDWSIAQSTALMMYIGQQGTGVAYPQDVRTKVKIDMALCRTDDYDRAWWPAEAFPGAAEAVFGFPKGFVKTEEGKAKLKKVREDFVNIYLPEYMYKYEEMITESGGFLCTADAPSIADFGLLPKLRVLKHDKFEFIPPDCLDRFEVISDYYDRMMNIPVFKDWYEQHPNTNHQLAQ